jgi:DNA polymerase III delta prime subunit
MASRGDASPAFLRSGIPSIDALLGGGVGIRAITNSTTNLCIIGPPGCGKTTIGLNYAASFARSNVSPRPHQGRTIYISTDFPFAWAHEVWTQNVGRGSLPRAEGAEPALVRYSAHGSQAEDGAPPLSVLLSTESSLSNVSAEVAYVELASRSQDDWGFIDRLVTLLPDRSVPHLLVVDAMDGLGNWHLDETQAEIGRSARNRLVQFLQAAKGRCHIVLIAEEPSPGTFRSEESVCDNVFRLGKSKAGYSVEVVKSRGQPHVRGSKLFLRFPDEETILSISGSSAKKVFIGHGRSQDWRDLKDFIGERLGLEWVEFNRDPVAGITTTDRLGMMLEQASFAFLVFSAEDEHADGKKHARENVVHELGLFQGRLGFRRAIILLEEGCAEFSNINGLTHISYPKGNLRYVFEDLRKVLEREGVLS